MRKIPHFSLNYHYRLVTHSLKIQKCLSKTAVTSKCCSAKTASYSKPVMEGLD